MLKTNKLDYHDGDTTLEAYYAYDDKISGKRPAVLIAHDWSGKNDFACRKADKLAELGYLGFAVDMFGKGKIGTTKDEKVALITPLMQDRDALQKRILAAFATMQTLAEVDSNKIGAMGFCFGGLVVLDLARTGADVSGVVSFHGLLSAPDNIANPHIKGKILALHGFDDPMVSPDAVIAFGQEMTAVKADWQCHIYGNAMHAFTNPQAHDTVLGTVYNKNAEARSWLAMKNFFAEVFGA